LISSRPAIRGVHSEEWIAGVIEQVLGAVSYCHDRGVAHQDLKPDNILLSAPVEQQRKGVFRSRLVVPSVVVSDFGQAAMFGFSKDHGGGFKIGDPRYASPDAWKQQFSMANDVWAVGVTLYERSPEACCRSWGRRCRCGASPTRTSGAR